MLDTQSCYQALQARDARFDGAFFVGVKTTGIYCRAVCPAKTPRPESCEFFPVAAAAEHAGYRPCLRCRPELAPGRARLDATGRLAAAALQRIEDGALDEGDLPGLAAELGVSDRHLRRAVVQEFGVTPLQLAQTGRLLLAKRLLTDTRLPITEVAFASGFSSVRRFNALFQSAYRMRPGDLRRGRPESETAGECLVCELAYRPPLDWDGMLRFIGARAMGGVEAVVGRRYLRTVALRGRRGWISVEPVEGRPLLRVELSGELAPVLRPALTRVKRLFDLYADPEKVAAGLGEIAAPYPGIRVPGAFDGFEMALRAILGQQVSVRAATTLSGRFVQAFGDPVETPHPDLTHTAVTAERLATASVEEIRACGIPGARAHSIHCLAQALASGELILNPGVDREQVMERLLRLPGVGEWTAQYLAMRALAWPDAFPHGDLVLRQVLGMANAKQVLECGEEWRPWRAYAAMCLWRSLEAR